MTKRIFNLDLLRFIAIILVIYVHFFESFELIENRKILKIGSYGVEIFFVLSGFLITNIWYKKESNNLGIFWLGRFLRTYPPYIIALLISFFSAFVFKDIHFDYLYLFFFQNYYQSIPYFRVSWSLCIEEHFYVLFPIIILLTESVIKNKKFNLIIWTLIFITPLINRYFFGNYLGGFNYNSTATHLKFDGIALGCLIAYVINNFNINIKSNYKISIFLLCAYILTAYSFANYNTHFQYVFLYSLLVLIAGVLLISFYFSSNYPISSNILVKTISKMAYSIYLTHNLVIQLLLKLEEILKIKMVIIGLPLIFGVAYLFYLFVENPSIIFRNKLIEKLNYKFI
jgi:peptidoglycan/LPS O-acetylase OafA/YrhL